MKRQLSIIATALVVLFILGPSIGWSTTYYGSNLTTTFPWRSQITVFNSGDESASFDITVNNNAGEEVWKAEYDVPAYNAVDLFGAEVKTLALENNSTYLPAEEGTFFIETASPAVTPRLPTGMKTTLPSA